MKLRKIYADSIRGFHESTQRYMIAEAPHSHMDSSTVPPEFKFLIGATVDLGFETLGLTGQEANKLTWAFSNEGVKIPGTALKMRFASGPEMAIIEPANGTEPLTLPEHWRQAVSVLGNNDQFTWIGRLVKEKRPDRVGEIDYSKYVESPDGWTLNQA